MNKLKQKKKRQSILYEKRKKLNFRDKQIEKETE